MTLEDPLLFDLQVWKNVTPSCQDLLQRMLCKDPVERINLVDALNHKFFESVRDEYGASPINIKK